MMGYNKWYSKTHEHDWGMIKEKQLETMNMANCVRWFLGESVLITQRRTAIACSSP